MLADLPDPAGREKPYTSLHFAAAHTFGEGRRRMFLPTDLQHGSVV